MSVDRYVLDTLKDLQVSVSRLSNSMNGSNRNQIMRSKSVNSSAYSTYGELRTLEFYLDRIRDRDEIYVNVHEALESLSPLIKNINFDSGKIYITVPVGNPNFDVVEEVVSSIAGLGYTIEEFDQYYYRLHEDF